MDGIDMNNTLPHSLGYNALPEEDAKNQLSKWLENFGISVFWEKQNEYGYDIFTVKTGRKKPDLLIIWKDNAVLIEVKDASSKNSNVYDAFFQLLGYKNKIKECYVDDKRIIVTGWLVATQYSIQGRLFKNESLLDYEHFSGMRQRAACDGALPLNEYMMTEMFIRLLWRAPQTKNVFIGALLSSTLNDPYNAPTPMILGKKDGQQIFKGISA